MKTRTPLSMCQNTLSDIRTIYNFSETVPIETRDKFRNKECDIHPTKSTCKNYDV